MTVSVGQTASRSMTVTSDIVKRYAELTGDFNPLHFNEDFTSRTRFERLISQGGIAVGLVHALVAMDMPGAGTVFTEQHLDLPCACLHWRHDHCDGHDYGMAIRTKSRKHGFRNREPGRCKGAYRINWRLPGCSEVLTETSPIRIHA